MAAAYRSRASGATAFVSSTRYLTDATLYPSGNATTAIGASLLFTTTMDPSFSTASAMACAIAYRSGFATKQTA
ncbi:MAG: hypothetical protein R2911_09555 [Caldilineaceae bacterium]